MRSSRKRSYARSKSAAAAKKRRTISKKAAPKPNFIKLFRNPVVKADKSLRDVAVYSTGPITLNPGLGGTAASYVFSCNGLYDPDITGAGHQALGFDQYMAIYNKYVVLGATIKAVFTNLEPAQAQICCIALQDQTTTASDVGRYIENGNTVWNMIGRSGVANAPLTLTHRVNISEFFRQDTFDDSNFQGDSANNPTEQCYFILAVQPSDHATDTSACYCEVEIRYDVVYRYPALAIQS